MTLSAKKAVFALLLATSSAVMAQNPKPLPLRLIQIIALPGVEGRLDHLTVDPKRRRVIVSGLGNNTVEVVDAFAGRRIQTIKGFTKPQGVLYAANVDKLFVANEGTGKVNIYEGENYKLLNVVDFEDNSDNLRYDEDAKRVYVGYGEGAIGAIDAVTGKRLDINFKLKAHPESFQLEKSGSRIFVNLADEQRIAVIDRNTGSVKELRLANAQKNFPMAFDEVNKRIVIGTRRPSRFLVLDAATGKETLRLTASADMDDLMVDAQRKRIYLAGADGFLNVYQQKGPDDYQNIGNIPSRVGARTGVYYLQRDRVYLAVPSAGDQQAALWVYEPVD